MLKKLLLWLLALCVAVPAAGCAADRPPKPPKETLRVAFTTAFWGDGWMKALAAGFKKQYPQVTVQLEGDAKLESRIGPILAAGGDMPDVAFIPRTNWQVWAQKGYLQDLSDLYGEMTGGRTMEQALQPGARAVGLFRGRYWAVPWGDSPSGLLYNADLFAENGWQVPGTTGALEALLPRIRSADIAPFAWSGENGGYWDGVVTGWWAQIEGAEGVARYLKMDSPAVYDQTSRLDALSEYQKIIADDRNSVDNPAGIDAAKAADLFNSGKAAMMPGGYLAYLLNKRQPSDGVNLQMMPLPAITGATQGNLICLQSVGLFIEPAQAKNAGPARKFLGYLAADGALSAFTHQTGLPTPFLYDAFAARQENALSASAVLLWQNSVRAYLYSPSPVYSNEFFDWPGSGSPVMRIFSGAVTAREAFESSRNYAAAHWDEAQQRYAGLR